MIIVLMGVSGSGKTTVGRRLAAELGWNFYEGDEYHPSENLDKMRRGIPLTDTDRTPWLESLRELIYTFLANGESAVLACSALKEKYREYLLIDPAVVLIYLQGDYETIHARLQNRTGHFMNPSLLESQFAALEEPESALRVSIALDPAEIVRTIIKALNL
jgi:carbohydrate kinase (thermoresistant glucokinase family)